MAGEFPQGNVGNEAERRKELTTYLWREKQFTGLSSSHGGHREEKIKRSSRF